MEFSLIFPIRMIPQDVLKIESLAEKIPGWVPVEYPGGRYKGQDESVTVAAGLCGIAASKDLPDDIVYNITKALYDFRQEIADGYPCYTYMVENDKNLLKGIPIPLHPGAERFWREKGLIK